MPSKKEKIVLNLFYNRFYDLYDELMDDNLFKKTPEYRFLKIREIFSVYKELLNYEPIKQYLNYIKSGGRPPLEGFIVDDLFSFIRNVLLHFPFFDKWDDVYISKALATWNTKGTINKFLQKSTKIKIDGKGIIKYRIWENSKKQMTYISINFPEKYGETNKIFLKNIISENDGIKLSICFMKKIIETQVYPNKPGDITIMSQVYIPKE